MPSLPYLSPRSHESSPKPTWSFSAQLFHFFFKSPAASLIFPRSKNVEEEKSGQESPYLLFLWARQIFQHACAFGGASQGPPAQPLQLLLPDHSYRLSPGSPVIHNLHLLLESSNPLRRGPWARLNSRSHHAPSCSVCGYFLTVVSYFPTLSSQIWL